MKNDDQECLENMKSFEEGFEDLMKKVLIVWESLGQRDHGENFELYCSQI